MVSSPGVTYQTWFFWSSLNPVQADSRSVTVEIVNSGEKMEFERQ